MAYTEPAQTPSHRVPRTLVAGLLVVCVAIGAALGYELHESSPSSAGPAIDVPRGAYARLQPLPRRAVAAAEALIDLFRGERARPPLPPPRADGQSAAPSDGPRTGPPGPRLPPSRAVGETAAPIGAPPDERRGALGEADGVVPDGTTVFNDRFPGVARLNPALLSALRRAATDAANDGVRLSVTSGWRSPTYQEQLLQEAISQYGSAHEAARWVGTPTSSAHVSGDAVDIGPSDATAWLSRHGATYGLCRTYGNEPWHYELRPHPIGRGCPPVYADPTQDPRARR